MEEVTERYEERFVGRVAEAICLGVSDHSFEGRPSHIGFVWADGTASTVNLMGVGIVDHGGHNVLGEVRKIFWIKYRRDTAEDPFDETAPMARMWGLEVRFPIGRLRVVADWSLWRTPPLQSVTEGPLDPNTVWTRIENEEDEF